MRIREELIAELTDMGAARAPQTVAVEILEMWERDCEPLDRPHCAALRRYLGLPVRHLKAPAVWDNVAIR